MGKTTNILDLNNRLTKVEKENVAQNSYTSLKNKPKINGVTLTGNKSLADIGAAAAADLANYATLDNSGVFPDANNVTKELVYINGYQSDLTNYPPEVSNTVGILITIWFYYSGDLTIPRMQLVFTANGLSFCRTTDGTSWSSWLSFH